jgi:glycosyltransferase involved in cell wall biosynthesis
MTRLGVVTLNFNQSEFLLEAVKSVQEQDFAGWRLVIVDPGSTDGAEQIYRLPRIADDDRISILRGPDQGPADGLNRGFRSLDGEYCYYLNADDRTLPHSFAAAAAYLDRRPETDVVIGHGWVIDEYGRRVRRIFSDPFSVRDYVLGRCVAVQQSTFFRRSVLVRAGWFPVHNRLSWDGELLAQAAAEGCTIDTVNQYWGEFRVYPGTVTADPGTRVRADAELRRLGSDLAVPVDSHGGMRRGIRTLERRLLTPRRTAYLCGLRARDWYRTLSQPFP